MRHVEIIVERRPSPSERRALNTTAQCIGERLLPLSGIILSDISIRYSDRHEQTNIARAQVGSSLNSYGYLAAQHQDRQRHRISSDILSLLITPQPLVAIQPSGITVARNSFGHSINEYHEAIASTARYTSELRRPHDICSGVGFTAIHELGHLLGLVPEGTKRSAPGKHCRNNCIMQSPVSAKDVITANVKLPHTGLCSDCLHYAESIH